MRRVRKRTGNKAKFLVGGSLFLIVCTVAAYNNYQMKHEQSRYESRMKELEDKMKEEEKRTKEIEEYRDYVTTDEYVEEVARDKLGLVYDDEVLLKSNEDE